MDRIKWNEQKWIIGYLPALEQYRDAKSREIDLFQEVDSKIRELARTQLAGSSSKLVAWGTEMLQVKSLGCLLQDPSVLAEVRLLVWVDLQRDWIRASIQWRTTCFTQSTA